jgi:hypothetical protein
MSLAQLLDDVVDAAFAVAGDLVQPVTWRKPAFGEYDATTGTRTVTNTDTPVRALEDKVTAGDIARLRLSARSVKLLIPAADFTAGDPVFQDQLIHRDTTYTARECTFQGTKALWEILADI